VNEAFDLAGGKPFAKENLCKARRWLHFHGLVVCGSKCTPAQQIVQFLRNEVPHGFHIHMSNGNSVVLKGVLLLVAIAHLYAIRIVVFSTRRKPVEIGPDRSSRRPTVALLRHQDSILSEGSWYPLEVAKNWVKRMATARTSHTTAMVSPFATKRPEGAAPKRKVKANYQSINDELLKDLLSNLM
jgi:hypothetical protein